MASWLADQVGEDGSVLAVDRDVTLLAPLLERSNVEVMESTIEDLDWPSESVDLIHTRNVLMHIDNADNVIANLVDLVRPGGALLLEEADYYSLGGMTSPALAEVMGALAGRWTWARTMPNTVARLSVTDVRVTVDTSMLQGRSPEAAFWTHTLRSVEKRLTDPVIAEANGVEPVSQETFDEALDQLADDKFWTPLAAAFRAIGWVNRFHGVNRL